MREPKFTPGPWLFAQSFLWRGDGKLMPERFVKMTALPWVHGAHDESDPETIANMQLIAAAPELYEALSWQLAQTITVRLAIGVPQEDIDNDVIIIQSRAALAKARGETP